LIAKLVLKKRVGVGGWDNLEKFDCRRQKKQKKEENQHFRVCVALYLFFSRF